MARADLPFKYSNDIYATKKDVKEDMKTPLIDGIWNNILAYRQPFVKPLNLRHINSSQYSVYLTPKISESVVALERKITKAMLEYLKLERNGASYYFDSVSKIEIIKTIAKLYNLSITDSTIESIINGSMTNLPVDYLILKRYLRCLEMIENNPHEDITENTIGYFYSELLGDEDLTKYYRTSEVDNRFSNVVINKLYLGVPSNAIEKSMEQLISFINYSDVSVFVKAVCSFYYMYYVKPFETHSEEIAILLAKKILAYNDCDKVAALINFESLLLDKKELEDVLLDCQKYNLDLTYFLNHCVKKSESLLQKVLDGISLSQKNVVKKDLYQADTQENRVVNNFTSPVLNETIVEKTPLNTQELAIEFPQELDENKEEIILLKVEETEFNVEKIIEKAPEVVNTVQKEETKIPLKEEITPVRTENIKQQVINNAGIAIGNFPAGLTEEEASILENRLLEMNPNFTRGQAYFYARHCTIGMCYTISQYKKEVGCAYETARNSMDNLVLLGYYRKEQLKNKYIYTPVKRG